MTNASDREQRAKKKIDEVIEGLREIRELGRESNERHSSTRGRKKGGEDTIGDFAASRGVSRQYVESARKIADIPTDQFEWLLKLRRADGMPLSAKVVGFLASLRHDTATFRFLAKQAVDEAWTVRHANERLKQYRNGSAPIGRKHSVSMDVPSVLRGVVRRADEWARFVRDLEDTDRIQKRGGVGMNHLPKSIQDDIRFVSTSFHRLRGLANRELSGNWSDEARA